MSGVAGSTAPRSERSLFWPEGDVSVGVTVAGAGPSIVLLPAMSSISTRGEMAPLADRLASRFLVTTLDWPGFGDAQRPRADWSSQSMARFLAAALEGMPQARVVIAAGHAAGYGLAHAAAHPGRLDGLVLLAPTWRGPLPTMMGGHRPWFQSIRQAMDLPLIGPVLYRANVSRPILRMMAREHVYQDPEWLAGSRLSHKRRVTTARGARHASARFVTGALDPVPSREAFLDLAARAAAPILLIYGEGTPPRSRAEMEALAALPAVTTTILPQGRLAVHEEFPEPVAKAILRFLDES